MKQKIILLATILFTGLVSQKIFAQQLGLTVATIDSFPVLPDTAYENQPVSFNLEVINLDTSAFQVNDTLRVFLRNTDSTNLTMPEQVLGLTYINTLAGGDTLNFSITNYLFTTATYRAGNNIIVVWPRIGNNFGSTHDTLQLDTVYFKLLLSVNMLSEENPAFFVFPNPVTDRISINAKAEKHIEYVRILNDIGQEILYKRSKEKYLDVRFLSKGFYFIEIIERNGTISRKKFLKL